MPVLKSLHLLLFFTTALFLLSACGNQAQTVTLRGKTMGTTYAVKYLSDDPELPTPEIMQAQIDELLAEINRQMSTYQSDSEISRFNQMREINRPLKISADFAYVTTEAVRLNQMTQGALDITVGPLVNLWGFGPDKKVTYSPGKAEIEQTAQAIGIDKIVLADDGQSATLAKTQAGVYLDLSSIAKGFGVDKVAQHLEKSGVRNYLVEIGGELHGKGHNASGEAWRVGIEQPNMMQGSGTQIIVPLDSQSLATSGDYRNFHLDKDGTRLSHIINPQTRAPIRHRLASISVIADNATTADGLSTGLFVLGEEKALALAEQHGLAVFLIIYDGNGYKTEMSSAFKKLIN